jgi:hypothetical protein
VLKSTTKLLNEHALLIQYKVLYGDFNFGTAVLLGLTAQIHDGCMIRSLALAVFLACILYLQACSGAHV